MADAVSDLDLLRRFVRSRDDAAFGRLMARHAAATRRVAYRHTRHRQAAEDVSQAAFLVLAQRPQSAIRSTRRKQSVLPWLAKVCRYAANNWRRAETRRLRRERFVATPDVSPDPSAGHDLADAVRSALSCLPRRDRRIVEWRHLSQMSWDDVARHAGTTPEAARKAGTRALATLRHALDRRGITATGAAIVAGLRALTVSSPAQAALAAPTAAELATGVITMLKIKTAAVTTAAALAAVGLVATATALLQDGPATQAAAEIDAKQDAIMFQLGPTATLEIVGLSDGERFWNADGKPIEPFDLQLAPGSNEPPEGYTQVYLQLRLTDTAGRGELPEGVEFPMRSGIESPFRPLPTVYFGGSTRYVQIDDQESLLVETLYLPEGSYTHSLHVGVAVGPWTKHYLNPTSPMFSGQLDFNDYYLSARVPGENVTVSPLGGIWNRDADADESRPPTHAFLTITTDTLAKELRPVAKDETGQWHASIAGVQPITDGFFQRTHLMEVDPRRVVDVSLMSRPLYTVWADVMVRPNSDAKFGLRRKVTPPPQAEMVENVVPTSDD